MRIAALSILCGLGFLAAASSAMAADGQTNQPAKPIPVKAETTKTSSSQQIVCGVAVHEGQLLSRVRYCAPKAYWERRRRMAQQEFRNMQMKGLLQVR